MNKKIKGERVIRLDFNTHTREIIEVYKISPDNSKVRTSEGWVSSYRPNVIVQRSKRGQGFMSDDQVQAAIVAEREMLREKRYSHTAGYITAKTYPIKEWLKDEQYMQVNIKHDVKCCRDCPYASNNAQEHDDPFSSTPLNLYWYCNHSKGTRLRVYIGDASKISKDCPIVKLREKRKK